MEYKGIQLEVIQTTNLCCWKWVVFLDSTRMRSGLALTRADAVLDAEFIIDQAFGDLPRDPGTRTVVHEID
jgi:hypothetical protein